ncbi:putative propionate- ligase protein [Eutypa lata UCREL1]|uniref:Putative propionate-ligase protein n=1 Tax=Eutypa lata (strain UCR-EL1) TaxID=1287681 RepID=M7TE43_EUTLA|nr:putative propionate- ligase protein [Eutypa lata UCREL1]
MTPPPPPMSQRQHLQDEVHRRSLADPAAFWAEQAAHLHWHQQPTSTLRRSTKTLSSSSSSSPSSSSSSSSSKPKSNNDGSGSGSETIEHPDWEWFGGGEISTCYNCVDRHVLAGHGDEPAIYYDSPVTGGTKQTITYAQLLDEVEVAAGALREEVSY